MWASIKVAFLFIGAMIGAGFATGSELMVFFGDSNLLSVIVAGIMIGLFVLFFSFTHKYIEKYPIIKKTLNFVIVLSCVTTFITMVAGADEIIADVFNVRYVGVITGVIVAFLSVFSMNVTKVINAIIVPMLVILITVIAVKADYSATGGLFTAGNAINYAAMNVMLGGYLVAEESKKFNNKQRATTTIIVTVFITIMMCLMFNVAQIAKNNSMPIHDVAKTLGLNTVSGIIIYLAILSTLLSAGKLVHDGIYKICEGKLVASIVVLALAIASANVDFQYMVVTFYPISGVVGVVIICVIVAVVVFDKIISQLSPHRFCNKFFNNLHNKIHRRS